MNENGASIGRAQYNHELKWPIFDEVVDNTALDFQRNDFKQKAITVKPTNAIWCRQLIERT